MLPDPGPRQILVAADASAISAGTELAVYTGTHQWLKDPTLPDWKFPFRPGYSAAGTVLAAGAEVTDWKAGDRVSFPGNHASHELLTLGHERCRLWRLPEGMCSRRAALACIARYGMGAPIRAGLTLGRSAAVLGLGIIGQFALRNLRAAGCHPVVGIDAVPMRRQAALAAGADAVIDPDAGQVVAVGRPRGIAKEVNFYDPLHRRYVEVSGAHGNMLFESGHTRLAGAWGIDKAQNWLLAGLASGRISLSGLVTHEIAPEQVGEAYEGLLKDKENWLGVLVNWV